MSSNSSSKVQSDWPCSPSQGGPPLLTQSLTKVGSVVGRSQSKNSEGISIALIYLYLLVRNFGQFTQTQDIYAVDICKGLRTAHSSVSDIASSCCLNANLPRNTTLKPNNIVGKQNDQRNVRSVCIQVYAATICANIRASINGNTKRHRRITCFASRLSRLVLSSNKEINNLDTAYNFGAGAFFLSMASATLRRWILPVGTIYALVQESDVSKV